MEALEVLALVLVHHEVANHLPLVRGDELNMRMSDCKSNFCMYIKKAFSIGRYKKVNNKTHVQEVFVVKRTEICALIAASELNIDGMVINLLKSSSLRFKLQRSV